MQVRLRRHADLNANLPKAMITDLLSNSRLLHRLQQRSRWLAIIVVLMVLLVMAGWQWGFEVLRRPVPGTAAMNPLTAFSFLFLSCAFFLIVPATKPVRPSVAGRVIAGMVLFLMIFQLWAQLYHLSFAADLFLLDNWLRIDADHAMPNQIAFSTLISVILLSAGIFLLGTGDRRAELASQSLALAAMLPAFFSLLGHLYRVTEFYSLFRHVPMAAPTALSCLLMAAALLLARPGVGVMRELTSSYSGGVHARLFIPIAFFAPVVLGLLRLYGYWAGLFSTEFGVAILVTSIILVFSWVIWYSARLLNKRDIQNLIISADLTASEGRLQLLVNSVQDYAIFMVDTDGRIASWNTGAEKIKGYTAEEVVGKPISIFYTQDDNSKGEPQHNLDMAKERGLYHSEGWRLRKDGTRFWADITLTAVYGEKGRLHGFAKITRDRTEFKKAQEQIAYQARLMEDTSDAIISMDTKYHVVSWNRGAEVLYGYHSSEAIGRPIADVAKTTSTEIQQASIRDQLHREGHWMGEVVHEKRDAARMHLLFSVSETRDIQGRVDGYVLVGRDISERKAEEERLRQFNRALEEQVRQKTAELTMVFERMSDGIMAFDKSANITYVNQQAALMNKCLPEELMGSNFWEKYPSAAINEFGERFHQAMDTQQNVHFEMFSPSLQLWIECFMYPSSDGLSLFFRDISEKRKAQEAVSRTSEELRQLASHLQDIREEERATIAREIHDELGQQLTGIKMDMSWIAKRWAKGPDDELTEKIRGTLGLLDTTINTVRRIATELRPSILDDLGLVAAIEWQSQEFARRSGIETSFRSSLSEFHFAPSTAIGLFRICQESLTNVARHSGARHVRINLDHEGDRLKLLIRDDGRGIDKKVRSEKKTLGLLGMRERALMMGGELDVRNDERGGVVLEVVIPIKEPML